MSERWVVNASPLIVLAKVGLHNLLKELADEVVVPDAVADEVLAGPTGDAARAALEAGEFTVIPVSLAVELLAWDLGAGETAVLSHALGQPGWTVILDDAAARRCARSYEVTMRGTLAVVIRAKQRGLIPSAAGALRAIRAAGLRLDDALLAEVLPRMAGESWGAG